MSTYSDNYFNIKTEGKDPSRIRDCVLIELAVKIARREGRAPRLGIDGQHLCGCPTDISLPGMVP